MFTNEEFLQKAVSVIAPVVSEQGLELVDLKLKRTHNVLGFEVIADRPQGGITMDECARLNRAIVNKIEEAQVFTDYTLEVCSPGLDWPLRTSRDFQRARQRKVRFLLEKMPELKGEYVGVVKEATQEDVVINTSEGELRIPLAIIKKAVQIII